MFIQNKNHNVICLNYNMRGRGGLVKKIRPAHFPSNQLTGTDYNATTTRDVHRVLCSTVIRLLL